MEGFYCKGFAYLLVCLSLKFHLIVHTLITTWSAFSWSCDMDLSNSCQELASEAMQGGGCGGTGEATSLAEEVVTLPLQVMLTLDM